MAIKDCLFYVYKNSSLDYFIMFQTVIAQWDNVSKVK